VPVTRTIAETQMVPETQVRQVPVTTCRWVREQRVENVPVTTCRYVREERVETTNLVCCRYETVPEVRKFPVMRMRCEPEVRTRLVSVCVPETVQVTCYRPVRRLVPVCPVVAPAAGAPVLAPSSQTPAPQTSDRKDVKDKKGTPSDKELTADEESETEGEEVADLADET
jgi:hypothetical protein